MAKKYLGIVLTTRRYDMYRFVVYQYEDTAMVNTCPLCQLLRAIHAYSKEYMEEQRVVMCRVAVGSTLTIPCRVTLCMSTGLPSVQECRLNLAAFRRPQHFA